MIELSRSITFGQYVNNGSRLTRMDPRTKLLCTILLIVLVSYVGTFAAFAACLLGCLGAATTIEGGGGGGVALRFGNSSPGGKGGVFC